MNAPCFERLSFNTASVTEGLSSIAGGGMAVIAHDAASETGGAIVMAAASSTPERFAFFAREAGGLTRVALSAERAAALNLSETRTPGNGLTGASPGVPVDYRHDGTNGLFAVDRALTARKLVTQHVTARDFVRPGHVPTVSAAAGGVLARDDFPEAGVDLARLAGRGAGAVICDVMNADGRPAEKADLKRFAATHRLALIELRELMAYRRRIEPIVKRVSSGPIETKHGHLSAIGYQHKLRDGEMLALMARDRRTTEPATVHVHFQCVPGEIFGSSACPCASQLDAALATVAARPGDCLIYIRRHARTRKMSIKSANCSHVWFQVSAGDQIHNFPKEIEDILHDLQINNYVTQPYRMQMV